MAEIDKYDYLEFPYIYEQYLGGNFEAFLRGIAKIKAKHIKKAIDTAISDCFDLKTAKGNALDMWGRLLNLSRYIPLDLKNTDEEFTGDYRTLTDDEFRLIITWAFQSQNFDITISKLQQWLNGYFNLNAVVQDKNAVNVSDFQNMSEKILYSSGVDEWLRWVLTEYDLIPRPAGVKDSLVPIVNKIFAFNSSVYSDKRTQFYFGRFANESDPQPQPPSNPYTPIDNLMTPLNSALNTPFIDTDLKLNSKLEIEVIGHLKYGQLGSFCSSYRDNNNRFLQIIYNAGNPRIAYAYKINGMGQNFSTLQTADIDLSQDFTFKQNNQIITATQGEISVSADCIIDGDLSDDHELFLFYYSEQTASNSGGVVIKSCKIRENGVLVRDFTPVRRNSDGALGFLEKINGIFYENLGELPFEIDS